jgi:hypothetical protein
VKTTSDFIWQVPGEDAGIDAYNLVLATLTNHDLWFDSVCDHQDTALKMGEVMTVVLTWLALMIQGMPEGRRNGLMAYLREIAANKENESA